MSAQSAARPISVRDEIAYELVRDEWELLLAIGSGPTTVEVAAEAIEASASETAKRVATLERHGLVRKDADGFSLVPAFYERREGMSSLVRDLILRRLEGNIAPVSGKVWGDVGGRERVEALIARVEGELLPSIVEAANRPESPASRRFLVLFAAAATASADAGAPFMKQILDVLRAAATARSLDPDAADAYLWVAEMRVDPDVALEVGETFERFIGPLAAARPKTQPTGAAFFAVFPSSRRP